MAGHLRVLGHGVRAPGAPIGWPHHDYRTDDRTPRRSRDPVRARRSHRPLRPRPLLPLAHRHAARRADPGRAVQLGLRAPYRRHVRLPDRGHGRQPGQPGELRRRSSTPWRWLGLDYDEGPGVGGPHGPYRQSERRDPCTSKVAQDLLRGRLRLRVLLQQRGGRGPAPRGGARPEAGLRQRRPRARPTEQKAAFRAEGRQPVLRVRMPDEDITFTDLIRGEMTFRAGVGARLRARPRRRASRSTRWSTRSTTRRWASPTSSAARTCCPRRRARSRCTARWWRSAPATRVPVFGHMPLVPRRGQQEAVQARPAVEPVPAPRPRLHPRGHAQLSGHPRLGDRRRPTTCSPRRDGRGVRHPRTSTPTRPGWTRRRPRPSTPSTSADARARRTSRARLVPYLQRDGVLSATAVRR